MAKRRLSTQILIGQLLVLTAACGGGFALFAEEAGHALDTQSEQRALAVANAAAAMPQVAQLLRDGDRQHELGSLGERLRTATGAAYVVIIDRSGVRHSHPNPALVGQRVSEPVVAVDGRPHVGVDNGHLGRSANGKAPVIAADGAVVGEVSAGILESQISETKKREVHRLVVFATIALLAGLMVSLGLSRRLKRQTFGLELHEIAELLQEREAMLHGIREGVVTLDPAGTVSLVNDEARRLLGFGSSGPGHRLDDLVPAGRLHDLLTGHVTPGDDEVVLTDRFCLKVNRMPVRLQGRDLGAVVTVRDRTEHVELLRELDSVGTLTDALRAQQHEHANRMHTLAGLLELERPVEAASYLQQVAGDAAGTAEELRDSIGNSTVVALLLGKATVARERGVQMSVTATPVHGAELDGRLVVTVLGNLIDNALEATAGRTDSRIDVHLGLRGAGARVLTLQVCDNGPGLSPEARSRVFQDGYSTKSARGGIHRGLGLALVHRLVTQAGGQVGLLDTDATTFEVILPLRARVTV